MSRIIPEYKITEVPKIKLVEFISIQYQLHHFIKENLKLLSAYFIKMKQVILKKSPIRGKKYRAIFEPEGRHVDFGAIGYSDYTLHKDQARMKRYLGRHKGMHENWGPSGKLTAGWWSRWLLWSKPSLGSAIHVVERKLNRPIRKAF